MIFLVCCGRFQLESTTVDKENFSGIIIAAASALESELKRVFYTGFQEFMVKRYGNPETMAAQDVYAVWPERLLSKTKKEYAGEAAEGACPVVKPGNSFTMGTLPFMFYDRNKTKKVLLQLRMKECPAWHDICTFAVKDVQTIENRE